MDDVVDEFDVVGLVVQPGIDHVFEAGALPGREPAVARVVELVAFDAEIGGAALQVHAPVGRVMDAVAADMAVLHGDKIQADVVGGAVNVAVFHVHVLALIALEDFLGLAVAVNVAVSDQHIVAKGNMKTVAARGCVPGYSGR